MKLRVILCESERLLHHVVILTNIMPFYVLDRQNILNNKNVVKELPEEFSEFLFFFLNKVL